MNHRALLLLAALAPAGPALSQNIVFDPAATQACLTEAAPGGAPSCIGLAAAACTNATPDGYTTVGFSICFGRELDWWDARLNTAYGALMPLEQATDAEMAEIGASGPSRAEALRAMQRAWIGYRDAACAYERAQWGSGTGSGPATVECLMRLTAQQALELERRLTEREAQ